MNKIVTHAARFHVDEIFAIALLALFHFNKPVSELDIERTRDEDKLKKYLKDPNVFVIDVGAEFNTDMLNFDHHQKDPKLVWSEKKCYSVRQHLSGRLLPKSSCGLIWDWILKNGNKEFRLLKGRVVRSIEEMVKEIDMSDNYIKPWKEVGIFSRFNRDKTLHDGEVLSEEEREALQLKQFKNALQLAEWHLDNFISAKKKEPLNNFKVKAAVRHAAMHDHPEVLFFKNEAFNSRVLGGFYSEEAVIIAIYNTDTKDWSLKIVNEEVPKEEYVNQSSRGKIKMPKEWAALRGYDLQKKSGFFCAEFCHKDRFMMRLNDCTKEECLDICYHIIRLSEQEK